MQERNIRYTLNTIYLRGRIIKRSINKKATKIISNFITENKTFI